MLTRSRSPSASDRQPMLRRWSGTRSPQTWTTRRLDIMGEYATRGKDRIKIGTCEDMYYLRFDQRDRVQHEPGNVAPNGEDAYGLRFRFPWPDEDHVAPGGEEFHANGYHRAIAVYGIQPPTEVEHF